MKRLFAILTSALLLFSIQDFKAVAQTIPAGAKRIIEAYPAFRLTYRDHAICFSDGTRLTGSDIRYSLRK